MSRRSRSRDSSSRDEQSDSGGPLIDLLVIFVVVYVLQAVAAAAGAMIGLFVLAPPLADNPWTIVTSVYAHAGLGHLLSNSVALVLFGWPVARATTRLRFHTFVLLTGALAGVSQIVLTGVFASLPFMGVTPTEGVLGASGAVFALLGYLIASNRLSSVIASVVDVPRWVTWAIFFVLAVIVTLATAQPGVALIAHFSGFLVGLLAGRAGVLETRSQRSRNASTV
ncbi:rhomboid family intramembrane serine protease [Natronococcus pandeyae]|uniref:Rhomboid family intramembrane serine protease n=1 Tax=Natronococcus pandeyae TaxID=2055836 RepID=A0A8J8Q2N9_9EURY|nr:rhomboid family intramembrane serine protease [Natronococcus pandeyae]TYL38177.1 rhomboid family intramembrane serine protease [Natronococcus pandeyae]